MADVYAKIENSSIVEVTSRPRWFDDDGNPVSDEVLATEGYYPVDFDTNKPIVDEFYQVAALNPMDQWTFDGTTVWATWNVLEKSLEDMKAERKAETKLLWQRKLTEGYVVPSLGVRINSTYEDLYALRELVTYMQNNSIATIDLRLFDNTFYSGVTLAQLETICDELSAYLISLRHQKWNWEAQIDAATTMDALKVLSISF